MDQRRPILLTKSDSSRGGDKKQGVMTQTKDEKSPTIIIKTRDVERSASPSSKLVSSTSKPDTQPPLYQLQSKTTVVENIAVPNMTSPVRLIDSESLNLLDNCSEFLSNESDFLVVSCIGGQGVGKSTILSLLADPTLIGNLKDGKYLFPIETQEEIELSINKTDNIDMYISKDRIIFLDTQPIMSPGVAVQLLQQQESKKMLITNDLPLLETSHFEVQNYQLTTLLFSISHLVIFVQDYFFDPDLLRFLQTAEMLKPSTATTAADYTIIEYFPHLLLIQNKCQPTDFEPKAIKQMQKVFNKALFHSRLQIQSGILFTNGDVDPSYNPETCGDLINMFLIPDFNSELSYNGHPGFQHIIKKLRSQVLGTPRSSITHSTLTEKTWYTYTSKVWEGIKKSTFFNEYYRLLNSIN